MSGIYAKYHVQIMLLPIQISLFVYGSKQGSHFARNLREFGVARLEKLEVNQ